MESELEILGIQRESGKPTMTLMGEIGRRQYVGSAFVTFGRPASDLFKGMVEATWATTARLQAQLEGSDAVAAAGHHWPRQASPGQGEDAACAAARVQADDIERPVSASLESGACRLVLSWPLIARKWRQGATRRSREVIKGNRPERSAAGGKRALARSTESALWRRPAESGSLSAGRFVGTSRLVKATERARREEATYRR